MLRRPNGQLTGEGGDWEANSGGSHDGPKRHLGISSRLHPVFTLTAKSLGLIPSVSIITRPDVLD